MSRASSLFDSDDEQRRCLRFGTWNIRNGRGEGLITALRAMSQMNIDFGVLTETKVTDNVYTRRTDAYQVIATNAASPHQGGVALFYRENNCFQVESVRRWGHNVISFVITTGKRRLGFLGAYVPPADTTTLPHLQKALDYVPDVFPTFLLGDLNVDLRAPGNERDAEIAAILAARGLQDTRHHFWQRPTSLGWSTWFQGRNTGRVQSTCDYILATDRKILRNVQWKRPRLHTSDHVMLLGSLMTAKAKANARYLRSRKRFPLRPLRTNDKGESDLLIDELKEFIEPDPQDRRTHKAWVSSDTWNLVDQLATARREQRPPDVWKRLQREVKAAFKADRLRRAQEAGATIESLHAQGEFKMAWAEFKGWYKTASDSPPKPSRVELDRITREYSSLYSKSNSLPEETVPVLVAPWTVLDDTPDDDEIAAAVCQLRSPRAPGPSKLTSSHLKEWMRAAEVAADKHKPIPEEWIALCKTVKHIWATGDIPDEMAWGTLILLPKAVEGQFRGIGLLEIVWKLISRIIDTRIKEAVQFHDCLHGFRARRGTGTAIIEAKLLQQLASIEQAPLYKIFLDLKKAYDTLDRERTLEILEGYGVGPNARRLLKNFWGKQWVVPRQAGYFGTPFKPTRGLTQGDIISPTLFNVVCDAIIRYWLFITTSDEDGDNVSNAMTGLSVRVVLQNALFYADDGEISSRNPEWLQQAIDCLVALFERVGLKTNVGKTEMMVCQPHHIVSALSDESYASRLDTAGESYAARKRRRVTCDQCNASKQGPMQCQYTGSVSSDTQAPHSQA